MPDVQRNALLRAARGRLPSRRLPGTPVSRAELADLVNAYLWDATGRRFDLDDHLIGKWERGVVRWPIAPYRAALRAVLGVAHDVDLGFHPPAQSGAVGDPESAEVDLTASGRTVSWSTTGIVRHAAVATDYELISRRGGLDGAAVGGGTALLRPLAAWLEPLSGEAFTTRRGLFALDEVTALENVVMVFRGWRSQGSGLGRAAVVGQLSDVATRLDGAPAGPLTDRVFLAAAELARIAGSMAFDEGRAALAQRYYVVALRMAKAADNVSFGAVVLAALARQSFDVGNSADGLEFVALAQRGSRHSASPALRATLATREAWGCALTGSVYGFRRAVDVAESAHADVDLDTEPRWLRGLDRAELAGVIGARYRDLARHEPGQARHAVTYLDKALRWRDAGRVRNRGFDLVSLARVYLLTGEHDESVAMVRRALPLVDLQRPGRLARKLADWRREADPHASLSAVGEARAEVADLITAV